jgi:hypothetical protein
MLFQCQPHRCSQGGSYANVLIAGVREDTHTHTHSEWISELDMRRESLSVGEIIGV